MNLEWGVETVQPLPQEMFKGESSRESTVCVAVGGGIIASKLQVHNYEDASNCKGCQGC